MSNLARYASPALAVALCLLLAAFWLLPGPAPATWQGPAMMAPAAQDTADAAAGQWAAVALARPLFTPGRRPLGQPAAADASLPRLSAIIFTGAAGRAVFAADGQKPLVVGPGGIIAGYVIKRVAPDHVELTSSGGTLSLRPQFTGAAPAAAAATAAATDNQQAGPPSGQITEPILNPSTNPALMTEQNF